MLIKSDIYFYFPGPVPYDLESVISRPSGGTEKAVCFLANALQSMQSGYTTTIIQTKDDLLATDFSDGAVFITQEASVFAWDKLGNVKKIWWLHHFADQPVTKRSAAFARAYADAIVTLSKCQQIELANVLKIGSTVISHGVTEIRAQKAKERHAPQFVYASTPFRGLAELVTIWPSIKEAFPSAILNVCSSMATYGKPDEDDQYKHLFDALKALQGVKLWGSLNQTGLFNVMKNSHYFIYPCTWPETYCLVMDEAIAMGLEPLVTPLGALWERVSKTFELETFAEDVIKHIQSNDRISVKAPRFWVSVASDWAELIKSIERKPQ